MTQPLPLILASMPVQRTRTVGRDPNVAVVYATGGGDVKSFGGRPLPWKQLAFGPYRTRYDVDIRDQRRTAELRSKPLPSRGGRYSFIATVEVCFRVHDPAEVVRRGLQDAMPVVYGALYQRFRAITPAFAMNQWMQAEDAIRQAFAAEVPLPEGITIFDVSPRLRPDEYAARLAADAASHDASMQEALHKAQLGGVEQAARIKATENERAAMGSRPLSAADMAWEHLARHPEDTTVVLKMLADHEQAIVERQDVHIQRNTELIKFFISQGLMQPGDADRYLDPIAGQIGLGAPAPAIQAGAASWAHPPVLPPPAAPAVTAQPAGKPSPVVLEQDPVTKVWKPADGVQPVYVLVDESTNARPYIGELSDGVRGLLDALRQAPDVAPAIRLSVLGYADQVMTRLPLEAIDGSIQSPWLTARGEASYANAFETLLDRIAPDIEALKQQQLKVLRPVVFLLSAGAPADDGVWATPYGRLVDPGAHRYAPNIVACGVGDAPARLISSIATRPEFGYVMAPGTDVKAAIEQYWQTLVRNVIASGRSLINGTPELAVELPPGFRLAGELV
jgi:uncharacterized protein YegL